MKLAKRKHSTTVELNMTPMIDVVFLLLIFFMTVSQISEINQFPVELPKLAGGEDQLPTVLTINVTQQGEVILQGVPATLSDVVAMVADELARVGDDPARVNVLLRADERGSSRIVNEIVRRLGQMQITRIRIAVQMPQG